MGRTFWVPAVLSAALTIVGALVALFIAYNSQRQSIKDKADAEKANRAHQELLQANYDKSLNIIASLNEASLKTHSLLESSNEMLTRQQEASHLTQSLLNSSNLMLTRQQDASLMLSKQLNTSTELLQKTNLALNEMARNNYLFKDVKVQFVITYDYSSPNNSLLYKNGYSLSKTRQEIEMKIKSGLPTTIAGGLGPNGQGHVTPTGYKNLTDEITYQDGLNTFYITANDANHTLLYAESINFPNAAPKFQDVTPKTQTTLLSFQHQISYYRPPLEKEIELKPELLMSKDPAKENEYVVNTVLDFTTNKVVKTIQMPLIRREDNLQFKSFIDLNNNYLLLAVGNGITIDVYNVILMFGDDYATMVNLDEYALLKKLTPWGNFLTAYKFKLGASK